MPLKGGKNGKPNQIKRNGTKHSLCQVERVDHRTLLLPQRTRSLVARLLQLLLERRLERPELRALLLPARPLLSLRGGVRAPAVGDRRADRLLLHVEQPPAYLLDDLDEQRERLRHGQAQLRLDLLDRLALQPEREQDRALHRAQADVRAEAPLEVQLAHSWQEVHDDVVVELVVRVRVEALQVEWREEDGELGRDERARRVLVELLDASVRGFEHAERGDAPELAEFERE